MRTKLRKIAVYVLVGAFLVGVPVIFAARHALWGAVAILGEAFGYVLAVMWSARQSVEAAPKKPMFICDVHGPLPQSATLTLFEDLEVQMSDGSFKHESLLQCPLCFEAKIKEAKGKLL